MGEKQFKIQMANGKWKYHLKFAICRLPFDLPFACPSP
jgi:hypothetical protein